MKNGSREAEMVKRLHEDFLHYICRLLGIEDLTKAA
jgi:hypothetical protein